jgi:peptidoglycan LD-endopeptidase CwlK
MVSRSKADLHAHLTEAYNYAETEFVKRHPDKAVPLLTCTYRSNEEQTKLYNQGRTTKGKIVTHAKAGESPHNFKPSFAFDIGFSKGKVMDWNSTLFTLFAGILKERYIETVTWGGDFKEFKDRPHFELKGWRALK